MKTEQSFPGSAMTVREMDPDEQPREKLINRGPQSLSNSELLAILLRTGKKGLNVLDLSRMLLQKKGGLRELIRCSWNELTQEPGIATTKAVTLEAAFELARRIQLSTVGERPQVRSPDQAADFIAPRLRDFRKEVFLVVFLNNSKIVTGCQKISEGGLTATVVDPAEVMRQAILHGAASIIIAHNHPSGNLKESHADVLLTRRIQEAGQILGIPLDDHIIIAGDGYLSFREHNLLK